MRVVKLVGSMLLVAALAMGCAAVVNQTGSEPEGSVSSQAPDTPTPFAPTVPAPTIPSPTQAPDIPTPFTPTVSASAIPSPTPSPVSASQSYDDLLAKAAAQDHLPVIVQLALPMGPYVPEGELSEAKLREQRAAITATREALVESLAGLNVVVYAEWESAPGVGLKVDEAALRRLIASPYLSSIQEDSLSSTQ